MAEQEIKNVEENPLGGKPKECGRNIPHNPNIVTEPYFSYLVFYWWTPMALPIFCCCKM